MVLGGPNFETDDLIGFGDQTDGFGDDLAKSDRKIHLRIQKRNARKAVTTVDGLEQYDEVDFPKLLKRFRKMLSCNGSIQKNRDGGQVIQVQGDQRKEIAEYLEAKYGIKKENIKIHGY